MNLKIALINTELEAFLNAGNMSFETAPEISAENCDQWLSGLVSSVPLIVVVSAEDRSERGRLLLQRCTALRRGSMPIAILATVSSAYASRESEQAIAVLTESPYDDLLILPCNPDEVRIRIERLAHKSKTRISRKSETIVCGPLEFDLAAMDTRVYGEHVRLTRKETELLLYLARRANNVVSREQIAVDVWHTPYFADAFDAVLNGHLSRIREKLGDAGCRGILRSVRGSGVVLEPAAAPLNRTFSRSVANARSLMLPPSVLSH
jgi:two-component system, OmpR family, response regulator QseB